MLAKPLPKYMNVDELIESAFVSPDAKPIWVREVPLLVTDLAYMVAVFTFLHVLFFHTCEIRIF